ncbi:MAG: hypothetical protein R6W82_00450 [bacterium]
MRATGEGALRTRTEDESEEEAMEPIRNRHLQATARRLAAAVLCLTLLGAPPASAQDTPPPPPASAGLEFTSLVNLPIAGMLERGSYEIDLRMYPRGGLYSFVSIGLFSSVDMGFSFGAGNVIGRGPVDWNPSAEFLFKARLLRESFLLPALALGFASQGYGPYLEDLERYTVKSPGFFAVASKNYRFLGELGFHLGANKSREDADDDDLNFYLGVDKSVGTDLYLVTEYDLALNDNGDQAVGYGSGYLNLGVKWVPTSRLRLELFFTNLLDNVRAEGKPATIANITETLGGAGREIRIVYVDWF